MTGRGGPVKKMLTSIFQAATRDGLVFCSTRYWRAAGVCLPRAVICRLGVEDVIRSERELLPRRRDVHPGSLHLAALRRAATKGRVGMVEVEEMNFLPLLEG